MSDDACTSCGGLRRALPRFACRQVRNHGEPTSLRAELAEARATIARERGIAANEVQALAYERMKNRELRDALSGLLSAGTMDTIRIAQTRARIVLGEL